MRYENDELRRENELLKTQIYGSSASSSHGFLQPPHSVSSTREGRAYSLSPSISVASMSGTASPPASLGSDMMGLSMTSPMVHPGLQSYSDPSNLSEQPYSMVLPPGVHSNPQTTPESSGYASSRSVMGSSYPSLNMSGSMPAQTSQTGPQGSSGQQLSSVQLYHHSFYLTH